MAVSVSSPLKYRSESEQEQAQRAGFRPRSLDAINFLLADVRGALGPYLNVFLITQQHWSQTEVGWVTTISGLLGLAAQTPAGAAIDATRRKREAVVVALIGRKNVRRRFLAPFRSAASSSVGTEMSGTR